MTDSSLEKWLTIRQKWDPEQVFPGYKGFLGRLEDKNTINQKF